jgi:hypothetical protein
MLFWGGEDPYEVAAAAPSRDTGCVDEYGCDSSLMLKSPLATSFSMASSLVLLRGGAGSLMPLCPWLIECFG